MSTAAKRLLQQVAALNATPVEDVALLSSDSPYEVNALLFGPAGTSYANGAFKVRLTYGPAYPTSPPTGQFLTKIHHPNVSARGDICVNTLKRDWTATVTVSHILTIIKCLLISPGPDSALNEDAGRQLLESFEEFDKVAKMYTSVHAITVPKALAELDAAGLKRPSLSCGVPVKVLSETHVNATRGQDDVQDGQVAKKVKMTTTAEAKKKLDVKKKTLRRL